MKCVAICMDIHWIFNFNLLHTQTRHLDFRCEYSSRWIFLLQRALLSMKIKQISSFVQIHFNVSHQHHCRLFSFLRTCSSKLPIILAYAVWHLIRITCYSSMLGQKKWKGDVRKFRNSGSLVWIIHIIHRWAEEPGQ